MLKLIAYTPDEKWAFIIEGNQVIFIRPPFSSEEMATKAEVERAVTIHGWIASEMEFNNRKALFAFLSEESIRVWKQHTENKKHNRK